MESKSQNPEFRNNPEIFNSYTLIFLLFTRSFSIVQKQNACFHIEFLNLST